MFKDLYGAKREWPTNMAALAIRFRVRAFLPFSQLLGFKPVVEPPVFKRHTLQLLSRLRSCGKLRLLKTQQFERTIGEVGRGLIHRATLAHERAGAFT